MRRAFLINGEREIELCEKKAIIFGAGIKALEMADLCCIENVEYIVDSDKKKQGYYCKVDNSYMKISSPDILDSLNSSEYYICIFTELYKDEILKAIDSITNKEYLIVSSEKEYYWKYDSIEELFEQEYYVRQKLVDLRIKNVQEYLCKIKMELGRLDDGIFWYMPIKKGHKLCIKCGSHNQDYIVCVNSRAGRNIDERWHDALSNPVAEKLVDDAIKNLGLLNSITYYADEDFAIQKFCLQRVDFHSREIRKSVLEQIAKIHEQEYELNVIANPFKRYAIMERHIDNDFRRMIQKITAQIDKSQMYYVGNKVVLSHGDCHHGNIVFDDEKCVLIDWEFLCYTYEYYDVCRFLFYSQIDEFSNDNVTYEIRMRELYHMLPEYLKYYKSNIDDKTIRDAKIMLFLCEAIELLLRLNRKQKNVIELIGIIENHISLI